VIDLSGISAPIVTPFEDDKIAHHFLSENLQYLKNFGLKGIVLLGSSGEGAALSDRERIEFVESAIKYISEEASVILGAAFQSTQQTIEFLKFGKEAGAHASLVLPPFYYKNQMNDEVLKKFYFGVADHAELPIIIYHIPQVTGLTYSAELVVELAHHPHIIGIKDSSANLILQQTIITSKPAHFQVLTGSASTILASLNAEAVGGIVAFANFAPQLCIDIQNKVKEKDFWAAREMQLKIIRLNQLTTAIYGISGLKYAMSRIGLHPGEARLPLQPLPDPAKKEIDAELKKLELM
jgi:dihydrodipicolinate synthase/N-acetylneuraminate lyase